LEIAIAIAHQQEAPCFPYAASRVYAVNPSHGAKLFAINTALKMAITHLGLKMQVSQNEALGNTTAA
jgi:hypothetical protein